jgi:hypothetical protein
MGDQYRSVVCDLSQMIELLEPTEAAKGEIWAASAGQYVDLLR